MSDIINFCGLNLCTVSVPKITEIEEKVSQIEKDNKQQTNRFNNLNGVVSSILA